VTLLGIIFQGESEEFIRYRLHEPWEWEGYGRNGNFEFRSMIQDLEIKITL